MELWLDTHSLESIHRAKAMGILHGVTTNPSIVAASGRPLQDLLNDLLQLQTGPVAVQVIAADTQAMIKQAHALWQFSPRLIIKVPVTEAGLACMHALTQDAIPVMATAIFEPQQALLACKVGAAYLAPYIGRIRDQGTDPWLVLKEILNIKQNYAYPCKILGAGFRAKEDFTTCAALGVCAATIPEKIFQLLFLPSVGLTKALNDFTNDWQKAEPTHFF